MTKAFNEFYKEFRQDIVDVTIERVIHDFNEGYTGKELTEDDLISLMASYEDDRVDTLVDDVNHCLTEDTADMITMAREYLEKEGFTIVEDEE